MDVLFVAHASPATAFAMAPLAHAAMSHGHRVVMAGSQQTVASITSTGVPAYACTDKPLADFILKERDDTPVAPSDRSMLFEAGRFFGRYAATTYPALLELTRTFRPDLVVGGSLSFAAPLVAHTLGVPYIRQTWDMYAIAPYLQGAEHELRRELDQMGLPRLPVPTSTMDVTLPSFAETHDASPHHQLRFVPSNSQTAVEPWMFERRTDRARVCLTMGSRVQTVDTFDTSFQKLTNLVTALGQLEVELLVAAPAPVAESISHLVVDGHVGFLPLDIVAPTCDVVVHHAGGVSALTAINAGIPQVMLPDAEIWERTTAQIQERRGGVSLSPGDDLVHRTVEACQRVLADPGFLVGARALQQELQGMPHPFDQVSMLDAAVSTNPPRTSAHDEEPK